MVMATLFTESFITDLTADVNARLAELARRPIPSTKKLEQKIASEERRLKRLTDRLAKLDETHLDAVIAKAEEMGRNLAAKREQLKELQRAGRRPKVKSVREQDVIAALGRLCDLLHGDVGVAAQVLKAIVGDVVIQKQHVDGYENLQMVARFTINAIPALPVLDCGRAGETDGTSWPAACSEQPDGLAGKATPREVVVPLKRKCHRAGGDPPVTGPTDSQPPKA